MQLVSIDGYVSHNIEKSCLPVLQKSSSFMLFASWRH